MSKDGVPETVAGIGITAERRRHWRARHPEVTCEAERAVLPQALSSPVVVTADPRDSEVKRHCVRDEKGKMVESSCKDRSGWKPICPYISPGAAAWEIEKTHSVPGLHTPPDSSLSGVLSAQYTNGVGFRPHYSTNEKRCQSGRTPAPPCRAIRSRLCGAAVVVGHVILCSSCQHKHADWH